MVVIRRRKVGILKGDAEGGTQVGAAIGCERRRRWEDVSIVIVNRFTPATSGSFATCTEGIS
jgi:hypothetical protein